MGNSIDVKLAEWNKSVDKLAEVSNKSADELLKDRAGQLLKKLLYDCPYKTGRGKGGFQKARNGLGIKSSVGRKPNNNGDYRESLNSDQKQIAMTNNWRHLYIQNYGFYNKRAKKQVTKHVGWFTNAIQSRIDWNMAKFTKSIKANTRF